MAKLFANSGDPDQTPRSVASDMRLPFYGSPDYNGLKARLFFRSNSQYYWLTFFFRTRKDTSKVISSCHGMLHSHMYEIQYDLLSLVCTYIISIYFVANPCLFCPECRLTFNSSLAEPGYTLPLQTV